jgi:chaperonin GroEL (HSP60 family)
MYREGVKNLAAGASAMDLKRGIDAAVDVIVTSLSEQSRPVTGAMIAQVGAISANHDDAIGRILADAMEKVGKDGVVTIEESRTVETSLEVDDPVFHRHVVENGRRFLRETRPVTRGHRVGRRNGGSRPPSLVGAGKCRESVADLGFRRRGGLTLGASPP